MSTAIEQEICIYAKVTNPDGLNEASSVTRHVQYENEFKDGKGRSRVRMSSKVDSERVYEFTLKFPIPGPDGAVNNVEHTFPIDKPAFDDYGKIAPRKLVKNRYTFVASKTSIAISGKDGNQSFDYPNVTFEVDIFQKSDGTVSEWCKIDVEIQGIMDFLHSKYPNAAVDTLIIAIAQLPFKPTDAILSTTEDADQKAKLGQLWDEEFRQR